MKGYRTGVDLNRTHFLHRATSGIRFHPRPHSGHRDGDAASRRSYPHCRHSLPSDSTSFRRRRRPCTYIGKYVTTPTTIPIDHATGITPHHHPRVNTCLAENTTAAFMATRLNPNHTILQWTLACGGGAYRKIRRLLFIYSNTACGERGDQVLPCSITCNVIRPGARGDGHRQSRSHHRRTDHRTKDRDGREKR